MQSDLDIKDARPQEKVSHDRLDIDVLAAELTQLEAGVLLSNSLSMSSLDTSIVSKPLGKLFNGLPASSCLPSA
jgi:hypothetical protein